MIPYNKNNIPLARIMRQNMTPWERKLWYQFLRSYPIRFQRQKAIDNYIVDFYCAKARIVIELDGSGHFDKKTAAKDIIRTARLNELGLTVIRIINSDVDKNFENVCRYIDLSVKQSLPPSAMLTPQP